MKKELYIFLGIFLFLSVGVHLKEWVAHPIDQIMALSSSAALGLGEWHPLIFSFLAYLVVWVFRLIGKGAKKIFGK
jgi:hypothetical protein